MRKRFGFVLGCTAHVSSITCIPRAAACWTIAFTAARLTSLFKGIRVSPPVVSPQTITSSVRRPRRVVRV